MFFDYKTRPIIFAKYIIATKNTLRQTAKVYGVSKSTVHNDISKRLKSLSLDLFIQTQRVMDNNFAQKHLRGGEATKNKFRKSQKMHSV